ncbi:MAG: pyruvate kinase [Microthrixaceae bacterium]
MHDEQVIDLRGPEDLAGLLVDLEELDRQVRCHGEAQVDDWRRRYGDGPRPVDLENLAAYLALRHHDLRPLQARLAAAGLSSLGRTEPVVMEGLASVLGILRRLVDPAAPVPVAENVAAHRRARARVEVAREALFGAPAGGRSTSIMVTLPPEAASDQSLTRRLVAAGVDSFRINSAHDDPAAWRSMAAGVRSAAAGAGRRVPVLLDLAGPKLRVGPMESGAPVIRIRTVRDGRGQLVERARCWLIGAGDIAGAPDGGSGTGPPLVTVDPGWSDLLQVGDALRLTDPAGRRRRLVVVGRDGRRVLVESDRSCVFAEGAVIRSERTGATSVRPPAAAPGVVILRVGDRFVLAPGGIGREAVRDGRGDVLAPAVVPCAEPTVVDLLMTGDRVVMDDGRLEGVVQGRVTGGALVRVERTPPRGFKVREGRGLNLPDARIRLPVLSAEDRRALTVAAEVADAVGCSFVSSGEDLIELRAAIDGAGRPDLGLVAKIETRTAVYHLADVLAAVTGPAPLGVMIARGDLAVEVGWERLAEYQRRVMWFCDAAHVPVVWATQVLERLTRTGTPTRAEVTDAAESERADCVMLNKGPHLLEAVALLEGILTRMQDHVARKQDLLPVLRHLD